MTFERINPITGEVASTAPAVKVADIAAVAENAAAAFPAWAAMRPNARRVVLTNTADRLEATLARADRSDDGRSRVLGSMGRVQRHAGGRHSPRGSRVTIESQPGHYPI